MVQYRTPWHRCGPEYYKDYPVSPLGSAFVYQKHRRGKQLDRGRGCVLWALAWAPVSTASGDCNPSALSTLVGMWSAWGRHGAALAPTQCL